MRRISGILFLLIVFSTSFISRADGSSKKDSLLKIYAQVEDTSKVNALIQLSTYVIATDPKEALKYAEEALSLSQKEDFKRGVSESFNSIGLYYYYIDDYETALSYYNKSIENSESIGNDLLIGVSNLRIGDVYLYKEDYEKAIAYYDKCIPVFESKNDKRYLKDAANDKAIAYYYRGNYEKALESYLLVLRIKEELGNKKELTETLIGIGNVYTNKTNFIEALKYYEQGLKISEELNNQEDIATCLNNIGNVYRQINDYPKALEYFIKSLTIKEELGNKSSLATSLMNIGLVYTKLNDDKKALEYYNRALKINQELGAKNGMASILINIGVLYGKQKNYEKAINTIQEGIQIAKEINNKDFIKSGYEELSLIHSQTGDFKKAYDYHKSYSELKDTLLNEANSKAIAEMQTKYETNKKEMEIKDLTRDKELQEEKQQKERTTFMAIGAVVLLIVFFVLNGYLAKQKANKALEEKNTAINKQKEQIEKQKDLVDQKNHEITDSINYAKKIQEAILPSQNFVQELLPESFVYFQPKDIVSGDFYWFTKKDEKILFAAADCTGHGVPGALMSMVGSNILNQIVNEKGITRPDEILNHLHNGVRVALKQDVAGTQSRDGMDIALCSYDSKSRVLEYAGANRSLYLIKNKNLEVTKANKMPIGGLQEEGVERRFTNHSFEVNEGDVIYLSSDGYADQFGGSQGKKFMEKNFKQLLVDNQLLPSKKQRDLFKTTINTWKGDLEQIDDILVIGVKIV